MKQGHYVCISRQWNKPEISIDVISSAIEIRMSLADFLAAVALEIGNPIRVLTQTQLEWKLVQAAEVVTESMKRETTPFV